MTLDAAGNLYIGGDYRVRRVSPTGVITTWAGTGTQGYSGDAGRGSSARLASAFGLAADSAGTLWFDDELGLAFIDKHDVPVYVPETEGFRGKEVWDMRFDESGGSLWLTARNEGSVTVYRNGVASSLGDEELGTAAVGFAQSIRQPRVSTARIHVGGNARRDHALWRRPGGLAGRRTHGSGRKARRKPCLFPCLFAAGCGPR